MKYSRHVGISFCNGHIQLAEIELGKRKAVTALAEAQSNIDLVEAGIHLSADHPQVATLAGELKELLHRNKVSAKTISFALPAEPVFINIMPLSPTLKGPSLGDYLQWELKQYFPNAGPKDFIVDSHPLAGGEKEFHPAFVVGVRRGMVAFLQKVTRDLKMDLHIVDVDHLTTEKTISLNYPEVAGHHVALFCLRMTGLIGSVLRDGETIDYRSFPVQLPGDCAKTVSAYLKDLKQLDGMKDPDALFFYGLDVPPDVLKQIRSETNIQAIIVNSLRKLPVAGKIFQQYTKSSNRFAPAIGLGLRTS